MDPLIPLLVPLVRLEERLLAATDEHRRAKRRVDQGAAAIVAAAKAVAAVEAELAALRAADRQDETQLDHFRHQAKMALRSLESGVGNPAAAERQLATCKAEIDRLETAVLERMEAADAVTVRLREARQAQTDAERRAAEGSAADLPLIERLEGELTALKATREGIVAQLPAGDRSIFRALLQRRDTATAWLGKDRSCLACNRDTPVEVAIRLERGGVQTCVGCGRWLVHPAVAATIPA